MDMNVLIWLALAVLFFMLLRQFFKINRLEHMLRNLDLDNNQSIKAIWRNLRELQHPQKFKISQKVVTKTGDIGVVIDTSVTNKWYVLYKLYVREYTVMFDGGAKVTINEDDLQPFKAKRK